MGDYTELGRVAAALETIGNAAWCVAGMIGLATVAAVVMWCVRGRG